MVNTIGYFWVELGWAPGWGDGETSWTILVIEACLGINDVHVHDIWKCSCCGEYWRWLL